MEREAIESSDAPQYQSLGGFSSISSQAIKYGDLIFVTGQSGVDPDTEELVEGGIKPETRQTLENIDAILQAAGSSLKNAIKVQIYLVDFEHYDQFNEVYAEYFSDPYPARTAVRADLGLGALVEVEVVAGV